MGSLDIHPPEAAMRAKEETKTYHQLKITRSFLPPCCSVIGDHISRLDIYLKGAVEKFPYLSMLGDVRGGLVDT